MTKKQNLFYSLIPVTLFMFLAWLQSESSCYDIIWCNRLWGLINVIGIFLYIFLAHFLLSLITYKLREETFRTWFRFACGFVPLSIFLIFLARNSHGGSMGIPNILDQETVAFLLSLLFLVISLILILYKSWNLRGK